MRCVGLNEAAQVSEQGGGSFAFCHEKIDDGLDLRRKAGVGGEHEDRDAGLGAAHGGGDLAAGHAGHGVIEDDGFHRFAGEDVKACGTIGGGEDAVAGALEEHAADFEANDFVIDTEDGAET